VSSLSSVADRLTAVFDQAPALGVAGAVVGVAVGDEDRTLTHGTANLNTGQPFTADTGFLLGSVTKILTTTLLLRLVERGEMDLDAAVTRYVPEFTLKDAEAAERITVRMLLNHTNGIDADSVFPWSVRGRDATRSYFEYLPHVGVVFEPGAGIHYSNPGFVIAARIIEISTGLPFERAIQRELFDPVGMRAATALQTQAFLRHTAVGAVADPDGTNLRATPVFTYGEPTAGAGGTPIASVADMLAFGRMHLRGGLVAGGERVLSTDMVNAMRSPTYDLGIPQAPPIGLGWWLIPVAGTTVAYHGGSSPGGQSSFSILPEYDTVIMSFATGPGAAHLNDLLHTAVVEELTGQQAVAPLEEAPVPAIEQDLAGEYASFQDRLTVAVQGDTLVVTTGFEPYDEEHREVYEAIWKYHARPPVTYRGVAPGQFVEAGTDLQALAGLGGRMSLLASLPPAQGRGAGLHAGLRFTPKVGER
jgi:CubicO group peptidase (beta-lactamase class C family)